MTDDKNAKLYLDDQAPSGMMYLLNPKYLSLPRWQRFKCWMGFHWTLTPAEAPTRRICGWCKKGWNDAPHP